MQLYKRTSGRVLLLTLALAMLLSITAFAEKIGDGTVTADSLRLRKEAGTESVVLSMLPNGTKMDVLEEAGDWYLVSYRSLMGYVHRDYVDFTPVIAAEEAETAEGEADAAEAAELALSMVSIQPEEEAESACASLQQEIVDYACSLIGCRYVYGGTSPSGGFDCSGFTMYVYGQFGYSLPHASSSQGGYGTPVAKDDLQMGDMILFSNGGPISHVGIYIGDGKFVHASSSRTGYVVVSGLSESYWVSRYYGARRFVTE